MRCHFSVNFGPVVCLGTFWWEHFCYSIFKIVSKLLDVLEEIRRFICRRQTRGAHGVGGRRAQMLLVIQLGSVDLPTSSLFHPGLRQGDYESSFIESIACHK